jgi:hypothetical protein
MVQKSLQPSSHENGQKWTEKPYFYFRFYIFWRKRDQVQKIGFKNGIGICEHAETNKYGRRAEKLN